MLESLESAPSMDSPAPGKTLAETQENAWIAASQRGDTVAFNRLVLKWEKTVYNLALRMLQDPEEAAETAQEVFLSAFKGIKRFRRDAKFSTWIYRIAVNHCITRVRRRPPGIHYSLDTPESELGPARQLSRESHEEDVLRSERRGRVQAALEFLPPDQRAAVELKFFQELTFEEMAGVLEAPLSTVKSRLYTGLQALKVRLGNMSPEAGRR